MRIGLAAIAILAGTAGAAGQTIESVYTDFDPAQCMAFASGAPEEGEPRQAVCPGYGGYPVLLQTIEDNNSIYFGFPPDGPLVSRWASFMDAGTPHKVIEWRVLRKEGRKVPLATIQRWSVAVPERENPVEVLVVNRVGLIEQWRGCIVGYVVATGNPGANEAARRVADAATGCEGLPAVEEGTVPLPEHTVYGYS